MDVTPRTQELIDLVRRDAPSDDPLQHLADAAILAGDLVDMSDAVLGHYVDQARQQGRSWVEISRVLGVSKQAVHKRFGANNDVPGFEPGARRPPLERFTNRTRNVIKAAIATAMEKTRQDYVGTEHLLLGMFAEPTAVATRILLSADISEERVLTAVRAKTPDGAAAPDRTPPWTTRSRTALVEAAEEASKLGHNYIGTEHLLLALYQVPNSLAARILADLGLGEDTARTEVIKAIESYRK